MLYIDRQQAPAFNRILYIKAISANPNSDCDQPSVTERFRDKYRNRTLFVYNTLNTAWNARPSSSFKIMVSFTYDVKEHVLCLHIPIAGPVVELCEQLM